MTTPAPSVIRPRKAPASLDAAIPRIWFAGSAAATGIANSVNLLFPWGERFFVRSVRYYLDRLDPALLADARGFFGQEGRHAGAHEKFFEAMRAQGYEIDRFLSVYEAMASWLERKSPPALRLSVTAAAEHFTAILADGALREGFLDHAHPSMRELLQWHAAEEIEHKAVAFDALAQVAPGYALRMAGLAVASAMLFGFWVSAAILLWRQDGLSPGEAARELGSLREMHARALAEKARDKGDSEGAEVDVPKSILRRVLLRGLREYVRPGFHPTHIDNAALARAYLERAGLEAAA